MGTELAAGFIDLTLNYSKFIKDSYKVTSRLKQMHAYMLRVQNSARIMLVAGGFALKKVIQSYADFEEQLASISTMLDDHTMDLLPGYGVAIANLAREFGQGTATLSKGLYDILSASVDASKGIDFLTVSVKAAIGGMTSTAVAADALTTVINSYGLSADRAADISDLLFAIVKRGKLTYDELADKIGRVASVAAVSGLSLEEMGASIATMTRAGLQADIAITSLRALLVAFLKPTLEAREAAAEFDLVLSTTTLHAIGLSGVLRKLASASADQLAKIMPNIRGLAGFMAALQNVEGQASDLELMLNRSGLSFKAFDKMSKTLAFRLRKLGQNIKLTAVVIGEKLVPAIDAVTVWIIKSTKWVTKLTEAQGTLLVKVLAISIAILAAAAVYGKLAAAITLVGKAALLLYHTPFVIGLLIGVAIWKSWEILVTKIQESGIGTKELIKNLETLEAKADKTLTAFQKFAASAKLVKAARKAFLESLKSEDETQILQKQLSLARELTTQAKNRKDFLEKIRMTGTQDVIKGLVRSEKENRIEIKKTERSLIDKTNALANHKSLLADGREITRITNELEEAGLKILSSRIGLEEQALMLKNKAGAALIRLNSEERQMLEDWTERVKELEASIGFTPLFMVSERLAIEKLFNLKRSSLADEQREDQLEKDIKAAEELTSVKRSLEIDFTRVTESIRAASALRLKHEYDDMAVKLKGDQEAMAKLNIVMQAKMKALKDTQSSASFVGIKEMWRTMALQLVNKGDVQWDKQMYHELVKANEKTTQQNVKTTTVGTKVIDVLTQLLEAARQGGLTI